MEYSNPTRCAIATISRKPFSLALLVLAGACLLALGRCATRPINPPLSKGQARDEQGFEGMERRRGEHEDLVIFAFSGGGTRAAAFSYGVLEPLRDIEVTYQQQP